jgi:ATP-binding cassette, subfamily F, member 3
MSLINLSNIAKHFGSELIFEDVSLRIERGDHVALVGSNGAGKSTLMRIIAGMDEPDAGAVSRTRGSTIAYLPQDPDFDSTHTLYEAMLEPFAHVISAQERLREMESDMAKGDAEPKAVEEYGRLMAVVEHAGYDYRTRIQRVLTGLGLDESLWQESVHHLSGGQRTRANLGRILLRDADVLLLDEPTNHLDIQAVEWLETYLRDLRRAFVIVAHDRYLLDRVTRRTLELSFHRVTTYEAPYGRYVELKAERMERQRFEFDAQQRHIAKTEEFVRRYGAGQRYKEARGRQKRLDRLERLDRPQDEDTVSLRLRKPARSGDIVLETRELAAGYPNTPLVQLPDHVVVRRGEKIALIGPNGSGKTTLLRTLIGTLPALSGTIRWGAKTSIGYYSQTLGRLDESRTALEEILTGRQMTEEQARTFLGRFLFSGDDIHKTVAVLSGGERSRVALAKLILDEPNVLVLDEPTNHLDIASRDALRDVLVTFGGTLLFVSHDRYLIDSLTQELWAIQDGVLVRYAGNYSALAGGAARPLDAPALRAAAGSLALSPALGSGDGEAPEERVRRLEAEAQTLSARLADTATTSALAQIVELSDQYSEVMAGLQEAQEAWVQTVRRRLRVSSGLRAPSDPGKPR